MKNLPAHNEGSPELGYLSLAQLQEFTLAENYFKTEGAARHAATRFFLAMIRRADQEGVWQGAELQRKVEGEAITPTGGSNHLFDDRLINLDTVHCMLEAGYLTERHPNERGADSGSPTGIGARSQELAQAYIEERSRFFGRQLECFVVA